MTLAFGLIGFADDYAKVSKQNTAGVPGRVRLLLGFVIAAIAAYFAAIAHPEGLQNQLAVPVFKDVLINLGVLFIPFSIIVIVGSANAVNLTDGLDGLAIMPVMIAAATLGVIAYFVGRVDFTEDLGCTMCRARANCWCLPWGSSAGDLGSCGTMPPPRRCSWGTQDRWRWVGRWGRCGGIKT